MTLRRQCAQRLSTNGAHAEIFGESGTDIINRYVQGLGGNIVFQQHVIKSAGKRGEVHSAFARENDPPGNCGYHGFNGPIPEGRHK